jgi:hypothetical protein
VRRSAILAFSLAAVSLPVLHAADAVELEVRHAIEVSAPVTPSSWDGDVRNLPTVPEWKPGDPVRIVPRGDGDRPRDEIEETYDPGRPGLRSGPGGAASLRGRQRLCCVSSRTFTRTPWHRSRCS